MPIPVVTYYYPVGNSYLGSELAYFEGTFSVLAMPTLGSSETEYKWVVYRHGHAAPHGKGPSFSKDVYTTSNRLVSYMGPAKSLEK